MNKQQYKKFFKSQKIKKEKTFNPKFLSPEIPKIKVGPLIDFWCHKCNTKIKKDYRKLGDDYTANALTIEIIYKCLNCKKDMVKIHLDIFYKELTGYAGNPNELIKNELKNLDRQLNQDIKIKNPFHWHMIISETPKNYITAPIDNLTNTSLHPKSGFEDSTKTDLLMPKLTGTIKDSIKRDMSDAFISATHAATEFKLGMKDYKKRVLGLPPPIVI